MSSSYFLIYPRPTHSAPRLITCRSTPTRTTTTVERAGVRTAVKKRRPLRRRAQRAAGNDPPMPPWPHHPPRRLRTRSRRARPPRETHCRYLSLTMRRSDGQNNREDRGRRAVKGGEEEGLLDERAAGGRATTGKAGGRERTRFFVTSYLRRDNAR